MRAFYVLSGRLHLTVFGLLIFMSGYTQALYESVSYEVFPSCFQSSDSTPSDLNEYFIQVDIKSFEGEAHNFEILVNGIREQQFGINATDLPFSLSVGPYMHSGHGGQYNDVVLRSLDTGLSDNLVIGEVVCGYFTENGLNKAGAHCTHLGYNIVAQAAPSRVTDISLPEKAYIYVLMDKDSGIVEAVNQSGLFMNVVDPKKYECHAYSVPFEVASEFAGDMVIGDPLNTEDSKVCYAFCGFFDVDLNCSGYDLSLTKNLVSGQILSLGDTVTYELTVHNEGTITAYDIEILDMKPDGLSFPPDINPGWNDQLEYHQIDSIPPGKSAKIYLSLIIDLISPFIEIVNQAEITYSTKNDNSGVQTFDVDSTPANDELAEDDQDAVELVVLENLCQETFSMSYFNEPICDSNRISITATVHKAAFPVKYFWIYEGSLVGTEPTYLLEDPGPGDFGPYGLTVIDNKGCIQNEAIMVEPVEDDRFACINTLNVSVTENCRLNVSKEMFIGQDISAIEDYTIEIYDQNGQLVDPSDLSPYGSGDILSVRIIHPCTGEIICWSDITLEYKIDPTFEYYHDTLWSSCLQFEQVDATGIIDELNRTSPYFLSAQEFQDLMESQSCIGGWTVLAIDELVHDYDNCGTNLVSRVYAAKSNDQLLYLDTAFLAIAPVDLSLVNFPNDLSNVSCAEPIDAQHLSSFPTYITHQGTISLIVDEMLRLENLGTQQCNIAINYSDEYLDTYCSFGASKVIRKWTLIDWCSNQIIHHDQLLYVIDDEPPYIKLFQDTLTVYTGMYTCETDVDLSSFVEALDNCADKPSISLVSPISFNTSLQAFHVPVGTYDIKIVAEDNCHNLAEATMTLQVKDNTPPVPIILEHLEVSLTSTSPDERVIIAADNFDSGSHDFGCGPVTLQVARLSEIEDWMEGQMAVPPETFNLSCQIEAHSLDLDLNGLLDKSEVFRDQISVCCEDLGREIPVVIRVTDQFGLVAEAMSTIYVGTKEEMAACDDGDPCTTDDVQYGNCPCAGVPDLTDIDNDGVLDCEDASIILCLYDSTIHATGDKVGLWLEMGARAGPCSAEELMAQIAGEIYTPSGDMIQHVEVTNNQERVYITAVDGKYHFGNNRMYHDYVLHPHRADNPLNGVTALDIVIVQEHILGLDPIDDPYKLLAADINADGQITTADIVELRTMILGLQDDFKSNFSWRFIDPKVFIDVDDLPNPLIDAKHIENLSADRMDEDWIGIKIGDVSGDAGANNLQGKPRSDDVLTFKLENSYLRRGEEAEIEIYGDDQVAINAVQFGLRFQSLDIIGLKEAQWNPGREHFAIHDEANGILSFVWHTSTPVPAKGHLFSILIRSHDNGALNQWVEIDESITPGRIYSEDEKEYAIIFEFDSDNKESSLNEIELHQNRPNPFAGSTIIEFFLPYESEVNFTFYTMAGELLHEINERFDAGMNSIQVFEDDLKNAKGIIFYQMESGNHKVTRSMISSVK